MSPGRSVPIFRDCGCPAARRSGTARRGRRSKARIRQGPSMSALRDIAEFRSTRFAPVLPDDAQVNPQVYGAELAFWLCTELAKRGVMTSYPDFEDWGWFI